MKQWPERDENNGTSYIVKYHRFFLHVVFLPRVNLRIRHHKYKQNSVFHLAVRLVSKHLRHCSKLINHSLYRAFASPSQRVWSRRTLSPFSRAPFSAVCSAPCPAASSSMKLYKLRWRWCSQRDTAPILLRPSTLLSTLPVCRVDTNG